MSFLSVQAFSRRPSCLSLATLAATLVLCNSTPGFICDTHAQSIPPITPSGLNTQISAPTTLPSGQVNYNITGGTRPGNGPNLFHSFGEFGVPSNNIANFLNDSGRATTNILGRVTGGNPSNIFGTIQTMGFGNANLFLMNPAGIVFGPNATLNVGGSVHFTTADYLRLTDGVRFTAVAGAQDALLSTAPVAAFGFLASNPAGITVQGSSLSVPAGQSISLVGGNISIQAGTLEDGSSQAAHLSVPGGQIRLASVASPGEVLHSTLENAPNINGQTFSNMGTITISGKSTINVSADNVSADAAGTVIIRGGQLVIADATISADTGDTNGASPAVDINVTGDLSISDTRGAPAITARTTGAGDAGEVRITSANLIATSSFQSPAGLLSFSLIDSHTEGSGKAGNVSITTGNLQVSSEGTNGFTFIDSGIRGSGQGGDITINANDIQLSSTAITTGDLVANFLDLSENATGSAGNITITADSLRLNFVSIDTSATTAGIETQRAGDLTITAHDINIVIGQINTIGNARGGNISIAADRFVTESTFFETDTVFGQGGGITVNASIVELTNGSTLASNTFGDGNAGGIHLTATDHLSLLGRTSSSTSGTFRPSGLFSNSFAFVGTHGGDAGDIEVTTPNLEMSGGRINTSTETGGHGGNVRIAANTISMSGEFANPDVAEAIFKITDIHPSGIFTKTVGSDGCSGPCGDAGRISITTGSLVMGSGSAIDSGTSSTGRGGDIAINATGNISLSGTLSDGTPSGIFSRTVDPGTGAGGDISLNANQVSLSNGSAISAQSTSSGNAGIISITAADRFVMRDSTVTTQATVADGGNITIHAGTLVQLINSSITTSVGTGAGNGGNITIDPQFVILQSGSQILANAFGGNGGNINIVAGVFLISPDSVIDASSTTGISGNINIQSPINDLSGSLAPLPSGFLKTSALLRSRCSARLAGETTSSFVLASKGGIPTEPGGTLISPLPSTNVRSAGLSSSSDDVVLRVDPQFAGSSTALPPLGGTCSS